MGLQGAGYKMDVCFVIDATGSMDPIMSEVKARALSLGDELLAKMADAGKPVDELRMRVIDYADYASEGEDALHLTDFFKIPDDKQKFEDAIKGIEYENRGGDIPENALEALYAAMMSDWVKINAAAGEKGRHIIVVMTDAQPLNLGERKGCIGYPEDLPETLADLEEMWSPSGQSSMTKLNNSAKRLLLFVPQGKDSAGHDWEEVAGWEQTTRKIVSAAEGLKDANLDSIIAEVVKSV